MTGADDTTQPPHDGSAPAPAPRDGTAGPGPAGGDPVDVTPEEARKLEALLDQVEGQDEAAEKPQRFTDSYGLVLTLLVATYFVTAIGGDHAWGRAASLVLLAATTWLALRASRVERLLLRWALALIPIITVVAVVATLLGSEETGKGVAAALTVLLVVVAPVAIVKRLASHPIVSLNTFYGAVCVYLLIAMWFASVYSVTGWVQGTPFFAQIQPPAKAGVVDYLYFSFITITTVGYGDLVPVTFLGRMTAFSLMVAGIGIIGALASILASLLVAPAPSEEAEAQAAPTADAPAVTPAPAAGPASAAPDAVAVELARLREEIAELRAAISRAPG